MQGKVSMKQSDGAQGRAQAQSRWVPRLLRRASIAQTLVVFAGIQLCTGCDMGSGGSGALTGRSESAPPISEVDDQNQYRPYRATGDLQRPRYFHMGINAKNGRPMIFGGTDERGLSGIDTVEIYEQSSFDPNRPKPESGAGLWIDTDFEGDPIAFGLGPRVFATLNRLADGRIIVIGGAPDFLPTEVYAKAEIFDPETRTFETVESDMVDPRYRHTSIQLNDGSLLIVGGQIRSSVTVFDQQAVIPGGQPVQFQVTVFASIPDAELFVPTEVAFETLTLPETTTPSRLNTPRGRSNHAMVRIAGPDRGLNTADDLFVIAGGYQTLSGQFAPRSKFIGAVARQQAAGLSSIEFFDPTTRVFTQVSNVSVPNPRMNDPHIMNLGTFNDFTIDGTKGMGNAILITHGDSDAACPETPLQDEVFVANYTGFGPAQGLQFAAISDRQTGSHAQGVEYPPPPPPPIDPRIFIARSGTNPVAFPRRMVNVTGQTSEQTWIASSGGIDIFETPQGCFFNTQSPTMRSGCMFDPYYSLPAVAVGFSPRDLVSQRSDTNPLGIIGCWVTLDGKIPAPGLTPDTFLNGFGDLRTPARWAKNVASTRIFCHNMRVAGEDGVIDTPDDRMLLTGGGLDYFQIGGEPTAPSAELLVIPGANTKTPTP